jgi:hypothetical protein
MLVSEIGKVQAKTKPAPDVLLPLLAGEGAVSRKFKVMASIGDMRF